VVSPASHKISRVSWYSGYQPICCVLFLDGTLTLSGHAFQSCWSETKQMLWSVLQPQHEARASRWFGLLPVRSPLLRESRLISFRRATKMFQFTRCPPSLSAFPDRRSPDMTLEGLPHSESRGSLLVCSSPRTFRRSPRPSSASSAKASTLDGIILVLPDFAFPLLQLCCAYLAQQK
jgi:hypothetical protein